MSKYKITGIIQREREREKKIKVNNVIYKETNKENVEVNVNKNTDENEIYKNKTERINKSIKTQVNRHSHTKHR